MNDPQNIATARLILIRGLPGSGKSFIAEALRDSLDTTHTVLLDPDAIDYDSPAYQELSAALINDAVDVKFHPYRFLRAQAYAAIESGQTVVWNQAFTNLDSFHKTISNLRTYATDQGRQLAVLVVEMTIDEAVARARVDRREAEGGHGVPPENFARFVNDYYSFADQGYPLVSVDGAADVATSVAAIKRAL